MLAQLSDESLMSLYCEGDLLAFKELYRRHSQGLYRFLAWRSPRREWVDEIAQDSWTGLHHARERYRAEAGFRTYLYQIARNRLIDLLRQQQITLASELGQTADGSDVFEQLADHSNEELPPDALLENKQQIAGLYAAVGALPGDQKEALILQQFSGMSLDEIAQLTGVPAETVKSRLRYAMRKLRQVLVPALAQEEQA
ncbi:sigma-70 family RNA polymerase sigma factor [Undibacterium sp.]|uniref:sigma-70 family RNA polymerase sigma factor n=1 Tax=Undibacterium sp. TaxID=1914977 RepID=UPI00374CBEE9